MYCSNCGNTIADEAVICVKCGVPTAKAAPAPGAKTRLAFILLGVFLGGLGIHNFYAGYVGRGVAQLLISLLTGWLILPLIGVWIWVIVELFVTKTDAQGNLLT